MAVAEGCVKIVNRLAAAGLTAIVPEVALISVPLANWIVILVATLWDRLVKVATPLAVVIVKVPCNVPLPAARAAVTTVLESLLRKLPNTSSIRITGCWAKTIPAVAVAEGWLWRVK